MSARKTITISQSPSRQPEISQFVYYFKQN